MTDLLKNRFRTDRWKEDSVLSVDLYNRWFMTSAPVAYRNARAGVIKRVVSAIKGLNNYHSISADALIANPQFLSVLRASTAPPLAIDRLVGLSGTTRNLVTTLEDGRLPRKSSHEDYLESAGRIISIISKLLDYDIFPWLRDSKNPSAQMINRSASIIADRISGALADPIIRNSQEERQLNVIDGYLKQKGYRRISSAEINTIDTMPPMTFTHHLNVPVKHIREKHKYADRCRDTA